ncbi:hypothetical protein BHE74_00007564 [Ensete ventricosum]|nr:hypothetical protein GW17_00038549 [Ensete ventricosum]RWW83908.1 hypothetical protein BHE74_00007564 [Ensete ventricosum]
MSLLRELVDLNLTETTEKIIAEYIWYGIEQEYTLFQRDVPWPLGWPVGGFPGPQRITEIAGAVLSFDPKPMQV